MDWTAALEVMVKPGEDLNFEFFDHVCRLLHQGTPEQVETCDGALRAFLDRPDIVRFVGPVIESRCCTLAKVTVLQALQRGVEGGWIMIDVGLRESLKGLMMSLVFIEGQENAVIMLAIRAIVEILKTEFPESWGMFYGQFVENSKKSIRSLQNVIRIFIRLSEVIEQEIEDSVTSARSEQLGRMIQANVDTIYGMVQAGLQDRQNIELVKVAIEAVGHLIRWFSPEFYLESSLIPDLCNAFLREKSLAIPVITVIAESIVHASVPIEKQQCIPVYFDQMTKAVMEIAGDEEMSLLADENFATTFLGAVQAFFMRFTMAFEMTVGNDSMATAVEIIYKITEGAEGVLLDECVGFWLILFRRMYQIKPSADEERFKCYLKHAPNMRRFFIVKMPEPFTVEFSTDDYDERHMTVKSNTSYPSFYARARECMVFLANMDACDTVGAFKAQLATLMEGNGGPIDVCHLAWAIGSAAGALTAEAELEIVPAAIMGFLQLCGASPTLEDRSMIACGTCFMCSQYHGFLTKFWPLMRNVVLKMLEIMEGADVISQGVIIECLIQLANMARTNFAIVHADETVPFVDVLMERALVYTERLCKDNMMRFYHLVTAMVHGISDDEVKFKHLIAILTPLLNQWGQLTGQNFNASDVAANRQLTWILKCHLVMVVVVPNAYLRFFQDWLAAIIACHSHMSEALSRVPGPNLVWKSIMDVKSAIVSLIRCSSFLAVRQPYVETHILSPICSIFKDFANCPPPARDPMVISLASMIITRAHEAVIRVLPDIMNVVFIPAVDVIKSDDWDNKVEVQRELYKFIVVLTQYVGPMMFGELPAGVSGLFVEVIKAGCTHYDQNICDVAHSALALLLGRMEGGAATGASEKAFAMDILEFIFMNMRDIRNKHSFRVQVNVLRKISSLSFAGGCATEIALCLCKVFPNKPPAMLGHLVEGMLSQSGLYSDFRLLIKNFFVDISRVSANDPDLVIDEKEAMLEEIRRTFSTVPGYNLPCQEQDEKPDDPLADFGQKLIKMNIKYSG